MKSRFWDKVTLDWDWTISGRGTSVRVDNGELDDNAYDPRTSSNEGTVHGIYRMIALSPVDKGDQRFVEMTLDVRPQGGPNVPPKGKQIVSLLQGYLNMNPVAENRVLVTGPKKECWTATRFDLSLVLSNGEQFCDTAIELARAVMQALGTKDHRWMSLSNFCFTRETLVRFHGGYMPFDEWLRIQHQLPVMGESRER
jgi:hypothetical protein